MRPDAEYIKRLLTAFQDFPEPSMTVIDLEEVGLSCEAKEFYFHVRLLNDQGFVEREDGELGVGISVVFNGDVKWLAIPLRLTASGHDFADALNSNAGWQAVKKSAISTSISFMKEIAMAALKGDLVKHGFIPH